MPGSSSPLVPLMAGIAFIVADLASQALRRKSASPPWWSGYIGHFTRPLAALVLWNALYRLWPGSFSFNPLTFPLYANPWSGYDSLQDLRAGSFGRGCIACAAIVLVLFLFRRVLRSGGKATLPLAMLWAAIVGAQLAVALVPAGWYGPIHPWGQMGAGYVQAARRVERAGGAQRFLENFDKVQPILPMHGRSHPAGATLLSYWTQRLRPPDTAENVLRLLGMASLNMLLVYLVGRRVFTPRTAAAAATLFGVMPASFAYSTFSQDVVYAVFFSLYVLLTWEIALRERPVWLAGAAGVVLFSLSMLTFSWSIVAAASFAFVAVTGFLKGEPTGRILSRAVLPPLIMLLVHAAMWAGFGFSYHAAFREALGYHLRFYPFADSHDWVVAFVGGQLEFLWGLGPLVAGTFLIVLTGPALRERTRPFFVFFLALLACYGVAVVFGPNPLKLETARCWYWVALFPVLAAAQHLDRASPSDDRPLILAVAVSLVVSLVSLAFLAFG